MKKLLALILVVAMCVACFAGCSKNTGSNDNSTNNTSNTSSSDNNANAGSDAAEVSKVVFLYPGEETDAMADFVNNQLNPRLRAEAGIELELIYRGWDQYWEQKDIMLAAGQPIDLYWDALSDLSTILNKGGCQPMESYIEANCQDMLKVFPDSLLIGGVANGHQYSLPSAFAASSGTQQFVCVRQDLLEAVGMTEIKTAEDLKEFATKVADQYPEFRGPADPIFKPLTRYFADEQYTWCAYADSVVYGEETNKAYSYYETEAFQQVAKFNESMYAEGLYSDELTTNYGERDSRMQQGLYLWVEGSIGKENEIIASVKAADPNAVLKGYILNPDDDRYVICSGTGDALYVPVSAKNPDGAFKFLNWFYKNQENYLFCLYGEEGVNYEIVNDRIVFKEEGFEGYFYEWMFRNANYMVYTEGVTDEFVEKAKTWDDTALTSDVIAFHFDNSNVKEIEASVTEVINQYMTPIMTGFVSFDDNYPAAVAKLKEAGIDEYVAEVQRQLDAFFAENGYNN